MARTTSAAAFFGVEVEANQQFHFGLLHFGKTSGFIYERKENQWIPATQEAINPHLQGPARYYRSNGERGKQ